MCGTVLLGNLNLLPTELTNVFKIVSAITFVAFVVSIVYKIKVECAVTKQLSKINFEIYLIHGVVIVFLRGPVLNIESTILFVVLVFAISIVAAILIHPVVKFLMSCTKRIKLKPEKENLDVQS